MLHSKYICKNTKKILKNDVKKTKNTMMMNPCLNARCFMVLTRFKEARGTDNFILYYFLMLEVKQCSSLSQFQS